MIVTYDPRIDAAYIYLKRGHEGKVAKMYPCDPTEVGGVINLDFDERGILLGIEVLDASKILPPEVLGASVRS